jgi:hypothetical protein
LREMMKSQLQSNYKRSIRMHKLLPSSTLRWTRKSSTECMAWKKLKMYGPLSEWPMKDQSP